MVALALIVAGIVLGAAGAITFLWYQRRRITRRGDDEAAARVSLGPGPRYHRG